MAAQRKPAMFAEAIGEALEKLRLMETRAEHHGDYTELFVDFGNNVPHLLDSDQWQVIFGRRGTGKTHLLGLFGEQHPRNHDTLTLLFAGWGVGGDSVRIGVSATYIAYDLFFDFLDQVTSRVNAAVDLRLRDEQFCRDLGAGRAHITTEITKLQVRLLDSALSTESNDGAELEPPDQLPYNQRGFSQNDLRASMVHKARTTGTVLHNLLKLAGIERLNILIDEWATLDRSASTAIQPSFAHLLLHAFKGSSRITVKIATNKYQTRFSNRQSGTNYIGLELEQDVFTAVNLDRALDPATREDFYETLLFKRLSYYEKELSVLSGSDGTPDAVFINSIFHDRRAFRELLNGSEGIVRRFLKTISSLMTSRGYDANNLWRTDDVIMELKRTSAREEDDISYHSAASQLLGNGIKSLVTSTGTRTFLVEGENRRNLRPALEELLEGRLVHEHRDQLPAALREDYDAYDLDYGLWLDWLTALSADDIDQHRVSIEWAKIDTSSLVIDSEGVDLKFRECGSCGTRFSEQALSFQVKRLCPECFEVQTA